MTNEQKLAVLHEIEEAAVHLNQLSEAIEKGELDLSDEAIEFGIRLGHVQEHLCLAWHSRNDTSKANSEAAYDIPNFGYSFSLVDP